jgi:hypothetical protein
VLLLINPTPALPVAVEAFGGVSFDPSSVVVTTAPPWAEDVPTTSATENMKRWQRCFMFFPCWLGAQAALKRHRMKELVAVRRQITSGATDAERLMRISAHKRRG